MTESTTGTANGGRPDDPYYWFQENRRRFGPLSVNSTSGYANWHTIGTWTNGATGGWSEQPLRAHGRLFSPQPNDRTDSAVAVLGDRLSRELAEYAWVNPAPADSDVEDPMVPFLEQQVARHRDLIVSAAQSLISNKADLELAERILRALGHIRGPATESINTMLKAALQSQEAALRDAALSSFALGASPDFAIRALREAALHEPLSMLLSAMMQTADQLEKQARNRAAEKSRTKKVAS